MPSSTKQVRREIEYAFFSKNFAHRVLPVYLRATDDVPWFLRKQQGVTVGRDHNKAIAEIKLALDRFDEQLKATVEDNT